MKWFWGIWMLLLIFIIAVGNEALKIPDETVWAVTGRLERCGFI
jgi:hypothetical protein